MVARIHNSLISDSCGLVNRTRLAAVSTRESLAWLNAAPTASVATLLSDETETRSTDVHILSLPLRSDRGTIGTPWYRLSAIRRATLGWNGKDKNNVKSLISTFGRLMVSSGIDKSP
ncbi:hypothetical protein ACOME3_002829 [Neoechinorhynchus agilis]